MSSAATSIATGGVNRRSQNTSQAPERERVNRASERDGREAINRAIGLWISHWRRSIMSELQCRNKKRQ